MKRNELVFLGMLLSLALPYAAHADVDIQVQPTLAGSRVQADGLNVLTLETRVVNRGDTGLTDMELTLRAPDYPMILPQDEVSSLDGLAAGEEVTLFWDLKSVVPVADFPGDLSVVVDGNGLDDNGVLVSFEAHSEGGVLQ